jgi:beta-mannanase
LPAERIAVGAYDPELALRDLYLDLEHWYVRQDEPDLLVGALAMARNRRSLLVTIEPFPARRQREPVLDAVAAGRADEQLRRLARAVRAAYPQAVLVRWGHEMDLSGLYPWAANAPDLYRAAFRRVVTVFREEEASNARWVWSPAGDPAAEAYYPGDDAVDYIGLTILGDETWDAGFGLPPQSFVELLRPRYERMVGFGKPIILAEVGVSGSPDRQADWLAQAAGALAEFPAIRALGYFNDVNAANSRLAHRPDWRLAPETFDGFRARAVLAATRARGVE